MDINIKGTYNDNTNQNQIKTIIDEDLLRSLISNESWSEIYRTSDIDDCVNIFIKTFQNYLNAASKSKKVNNKFKNVNRGLHQE